MLRSLCRTCMNNFIINTQVTTWKSRQWYGKTKMEFATRYGKTKIEFDIVSPNSRLYFEAIEFRLGNNAQYFSVHSKPYGKMCHMLKLCLFFNQLRRRDILIIDIIPAFLLLICLFLWKSGREILSNAQSIFGEQSMINWFWGKAWSNTIYELIRGTAIMKNMFILQNNLDVMMNNK